MTRKSSHLSMRRIVAIAVFAIIVPSLVLTLVGLKLTLDLKRQLEQSLAEQYATSARAKIEEIEARVAELEGRVKRAAERLEPAQVVPALEALRRQSPIAEELFLLREDPGGGGLVMLYPGVPEPTRAIPETFLWSEPLPPAGRRAAAQANPDDAAKTIEALRRHRDRTLSPAARARATQAIAAIHFRREQCPQAITEYRRLLHQDSVAVFSPSLALLARYQIAAAERRLGRSHEALTALLDLYADLVREKTGVADASRIAYFKQRARKDIEALLRRPDTPRPHSRRFAALLDEEGRRAARARFLSYVQRFVLPRLGFLAPSLRFDEGGLRHLWDEEVAEEPYVVAFAAVRAHDGTRRILGFKLDLDHVRSAILPEALRSSRFGPRVAFVVTDRKGAPVFGEKTNEAPAAAEAFGAIFQPWRLALVEREPAALRRLALYNLLLFSVVNGVMILAIIIGVVITLRGTAHELELSQLKSDFVSNVSHELKTPLALIRMFAETLEMGRVKSAEKAREYYSIITRESERLTQLINNVLDFSRIEQGRKTYEFRLEDLADVVRDTLRAYSYELDKQGFSVDADVPDNLPATLMDRNAISLALLNLLSNAVKYSQDDRRIRVACAPRDGALQLEVSDHGIGIERADLEKIFDKFYRARAETVRSTRGSGLGLAIVKHSIEAHGGTITVASEKGEGSTFTITLPIRKTLTNGEDSRRRR